MAEVTPVKVPNQNARFSGFITLATFVLIVAVMKVAEDVLIPIALTILLVFLLTPFVVRLTRWGLPKTVAIITAVLVSAAILVGVGWLVASQVSGIINELPNYEVNIRQKISRIKRQPDPEAVTRFSDLVKKVQNDLENPPAGEAQPAPKTAAPKVVPVEVKGHVTTRTEALRALVGPLLQPIGTAIVVAVFVITMLFQREDLRDRFIKVVSSGRLNIATQALEDAAHRVTRYLLMQLTVNICYGIPIGLLLYVVGVPHALLWGVIATLLRFIPFLGPWIAAIFPIVMSAAIDPGWSKVGYTFGVFVVMEIVTPNFIEPWLYGNSTGISNLALLIAAVFWTWLWGTPGLFLSTPLTVCIMVMGKYVPGLQFLSVLLGSEPVLEPAARFYQRMLSMDADEMGAIAQSFIAERSIDEFYNDVFVPALLLSERDRHSGSLAEVRQRFIFDASRELIERLERLPSARAKGGGGDEASGEEREEEDRGGPPVVFGLAARDDADEVVALMLQHLLRIRGIETEVVPVMAHAEDALRWMKQHRVNVGFVSALPPAALVGTRQLCRRIKEECPDMKLLVGVWDRQTDFEEIKIRLRRPTPEAIVTNLPDAVRQIEKLLQEPVRAATGLAALESKPAPESAPATEMSAEPLGLREVAPDELFGVVCRDLAQYFDVPLSLVTITTSDPAFWKNFAGVEPERPGEEAVPATSAAPSVAVDELMVIEDITVDRRLAANQHLLERGIRFYGAAPLRNKAGRVVGSLSVVDTKPRAIGAEGERLLADRASELMEAVEATPEESKRGRGSNAERTEGR